MIVIINVVKPHFNNKIGDEVKMDNFSEEHNTQDANDFELDEIKGEVGKKPKMAVLNKTKLSRYEMDDLFMGEE
jgi:hypothetical protein